MKKFTYNVLVSSFMLIPAILSATEQSTTVTGDHNIIRQIVYNGLTKETQEKFLQPYKDRIKQLKRELKRSVSLEEKIRISAKLNEAQKTLKRKDLEIKELEKFIENSNLKVVRTAAKILDEKGIEAALDYLKSKQVDAFEKNTQKNMKELAGKYTMQAKLLELSNKYDEAEKAYRKVLQYERDFDTLFAYASFLSRQNKHKKAIEQYESIVNSSEFHLESKQKASVLNNLAVLYSDQNRLKEAEEAYSAALRLYRALAKKNPKAYEIDYARTLITGVYLLNQSQQDLDTAEKILKKYSEVYQAEQLLSIITKLRQ